MALKLSDKQDTLVQMHPALAVVDDVLYVAVEVRDEEQGVIDVILTSEGHAFDPAEWDAVCRERGLKPYTRVDLTRCGPRWNNKSIQALLDGTLTAPTWKEVYDAIYQALDERIEVVDARYLTVLTLHLMMSYFYVLFDFLPILHALGPSESGKSRAGDAVRNVAFNGIKQGTATPAVIFRHAHLGCYTQVLAEADHLAQANSGDAFVRQLQSCCSKGEATVDLAEGSTGKKFQPVTYYAYSPRMLLSTKKFGARTLRNRCIRLDFVKTPSANQAKLRKTMNDDTVWEPLRDKLYRLQLLKWRDVERMRSKAQDTWVGEHAPKGRVFDKWLPLATIAALVSRDVLDVVKHLTMDDMNEQRDDAAGDFSAVLFKFLYWFVHDKQGNTVETTRTALWDAFAGDFAKEDTTYAKPPTWLKATATTVTPDELKKWVRGPGVLVRELQGLRLLPKEPKGKRDANYYVLDRTHIMGTVEEYLGDAVLALENREGGEDVPQHCSECSTRYAKDFMARRDDGRWRCDRCETRRQRQERRSA